MGKLIDAEKLANFLDGLIRDEWNKNASTSWADALEEVSELVKSIPESVVRCKDCKRAEFSEAGMTYCSEIIGSWVEDDWFCADGERREG